MIFPAGLEGVIPLSPGKSVTREFQLTGRRYSVVISRDESGYYEMAIDHITNPTPRRVSHISGILTESDLEVIYKATIAEIERKTKER